jgi:diguanylate cyclase (GGDEF)-like protein
MFRDWLRIFRRQRSAHPRAGHLPEEPARDESTGLYTNRYFDERLAAEIELAEVYEEPFSLMALGVDRIEAFRELHGDSLTRQLAALVALALRENLRLADVPTADGHDFLVLMPETSIDEAALAFRRLQTLIADSGRARPDDCFSQFTISAGAFEYDGSRPPEIVRSALWALDRARSLGGNTFHRFTAGRSDWKPAPVPFVIDQPVELRRA